MPPTSSIPSCIAVPTRCMTSSGFMLAMWFWNDMNASRPSRPTTMYEAFGNHGGVERPCGVPTGEARAARNARAAPAVAPAVGRAHGPGAQVVGHVEGNGDRPDPRRPARGPAVLQTQRRGIVGMHLQRATRL